MDGQIAHGGTYFQIVRSGNALVQLDLPDAMGRVSVARSARSHSVASSKVVYKVTCPAVREMERRPIRTPGEGSCEVVCRGPGWGPYPALGTRLPGVFMRML